MRSDHAVKKLFPPAKRFILCFVSCLRLGRADNVRLALPESSVVVSESLLECTLEELGLFPRAVVFATVHSETQREELLSQKHLEQLYVQGSRTASVKKEKK